jgi:hypothetical protein
MDQGAGVRLNEHTVPGIEHRNRATGFYESHTSSSWRFESVRIRDVPRYHGIVRLYGQRCLPRNGDPRPFLIGMDQLRDRVSQLVRHCTRGGRGDLVPTMFVGIVVLLLSLRFHHHQRFASTGSELASPLRQFPIAKHLRHLSSAVVGIYGALKTYNVQGAELPVQRLPWLGGRASAASPPSSRSRSGRWSVRKVVRKHRDPVPIALAVFCGLVATWSTVDRSPVPRAGHLHDVLDLGGVERCSVHRPGGTGRAQTLWNDRLRSQDAVGVSTELHREEHRPCGSALRRTVDTTPLLGLDSSSLRISWIRSPGSAARYTAGRTRGSCRRRRTRKWAGRCC